MNGPAQNGTAHRLAFVYGAREVLWNNVGMLPFLDDGGVMAATLDRCAAVIRQRLGWSLERTLVGGVETVPADRVEPVLASVQITLTEGWRSRGIAPQGICGRSAGETASEYARGTLTLENALEIAIRWGQTALKRGGNAAVLVATASLGRIEELRRGSPAEYFVVTDANDTFTLIACARASLQQVSAYLTAQGVALSPTRFNYGPHTPLVEGWQADFLEPPIPSKAPDPDIVYYSTGAQAPDTGTSHRARMWQSARAPALLGPTLDRMVQDGYDIFVEIGGRGTLGETFRQRSAAAGKRVVSLPTMDVQKPASAIMDMTQGYLRQLGVRGA